MAQITDTYTLQIVDKILAPLNGILAAAEKVNGTLERMESLTNKGLGFAKMATGIGLAVGGLLTLKGAVEGVIGVLEKAAEGAIHFGKMVIDTARFSAQSKGAFDLFLGKGQGERSFQAALRFGNILPMDEREVVRQAVSLASAGYKGKQLDAVNAALADVYALRGESYRSNLEFHFLRLKNEAKPEARDVKMAAIDTGVGMEGIMRQLFKAKGVAIPKTLHAMEELYDAMKKDGRVNGNDVANAILRAIQERMDEGQALGSTAKRLGIGTLGGLITNLQAAPERFLMQIGVEKFAGIQKLKDFLQRILEFFDVGSVHGQHLAKAAEDLADALFTGLDKIKGDDLARFFSSAVAVAERFVELVKAAWGWMDQLLHGDTSGFAKATASAVLEIGKFIGQGIWEGFKSAFGGGEDKAGSRVASAAALELAGQAKTAEAITPDIVRRAGGVRSPLFRAMIQTLADQGVGGALGGQVSEAQKQLGMLHYALSDQAVDDLERQQKEAERALRASAGDVEFTDEEAGTLEERGREIPRAVRKGMDDASERHSPPALFVAAGEEYAEAVLIGLRRKAEEVRSGGGSADVFLDELLEALRGAGHRLGAGT